MSDETKTTEPFKLGCWEHIVGDGDCEGCWRGYPVPCDCGGLIHAEFGDETEDGYWLLTKCDLCGEPED